jgi:hypothetical protein
LRLVPVAFWQTKTDARDMIAIDNKTISNWVEWWDDGDPDAAIVSGHKQSQIDELMPWNH